MKSILSDLVDDQFWGKLSKWVETPIDAADKADKYDKLFKKYGFKPLDMGTNRIVYTHKKYPKVVFKVAIDEQGILDSLNEYEKSDKSHYFPQSYDVDKHGYILVQKRVPTIDYDVFNEKKTQKRIRQILRELDEQGFVLLDLGSDKHKNYGMDKNGEINIIDFGYVDYKSLANFNCPHTRPTVKKAKKKYCKGQLEYNKTFTMLECNECGGVFKIDVVLEGYTHTRYAEPPKSDAYVPTDELYDFYKQFTKGRDRSTLTKYVEISNKSNDSEKGEIPTMSTAKERFLRKTGKIKPSSNLPSNVKVDVDEESGTTTIEVSSNTKERKASYRKQGDLNYISRQERDSDDPTCSTGDEVYHISESEVLSGPEDEEETNESVLIVDTDDDDDEDGLEGIAKEIEEGETNAYYMTTPGDKLDYNSRYGRREYSDDDMSAEEIDRLFFKMNPEMKEIVEGVRAKKKGNEPEQLSELTFLSGVFRDDIDRLFFRQYPEMKKIVEAARANENPIVVSQPTEEVVSHTKVCEEAGIIVTLPHGGTATGEIHLAMVSEELTKKPVVIISKGDNVYHINILEHIKRIDQLLEGQEINDDLIITAMNVEPLSEFDGNYDSRYFESHPGDEDPMVD